MTLELDFKKTLHRFSLLANILAYLLSVRHYIMSKKRFIEKLIAFVIHISFLVFRLFIKLNI